MTLRTGERRWIEVGRTASVRVPATSANLGPGYDALGLALDLTDQVSVTVTDEGLQIEATGQGANKIPHDDSHLVVRALLSTLEGLGTRAPGLSLSAVNSIPHGRGLGSSAAAICAGVLLARALADAGDDIEAALVMANEIEGHPDNVAACLYGGATIAWVDGPSLLPDGSATPTARAVRIEPSPNLRPVVFIPAFQSSTEAARGLLPAHVSHADAAFNAARAALLVNALTAPTARAHLLLTATEDRLHQPYRAGAMASSADLVARLRAGGIAAVVSGAGPSVVALTTSKDVAAACAAGPPGWAVQEMAVDRVGARLEVPAVDSAQPS